MNTERQKPLLSIVCAAYNEEAVLPLFHHSLVANLQPLRTNFELEIIYTDDGSSDRTWAILENLAASTPGTRAIRLAKNVGQPGALSAALEHAQGVAAISLDADLQHPPELIPELVRLWSEAKTPVIQTIRLEDTRQSLFKRASSRWFANFISKVTGLNIPSGAADFRLMDRHALDALKSMNDHPRMMRAAVASLRLPTVYVDYMPKERAAGVSKYNLGKLLQLAYRSFWTYGDPAGLVLKGCIAASASAAVVALTVFMVQAFQGSYSALPLAFGVLATLLGALSLGLLVLSSYLKAVLDRLPGRPRYTVQTLVSWQTQPAESRVDVGENSAFRRVA